LKNSLRAAHGRAAKQQADKPWMACPGLASDAGCESAASAAIFKHVYVLENGAKQKPRFLLCELKKTMDGLFQHPVRAP
jgi:hypothetical protein